MKDESKPFQFLDLAVQYSHLIRDESTPFQFLDIWQTVVQEVYPILVGRQEPIEPNEEYPRMSRYGEFV